MKNDKKFIEQIEIFVPAGNSSVKFEVIREKVTIKKPGDAQRVPRDTPNISIPQKGEAAEYDKEAFAEDNKRQN